MKETPMLFSGPMVRAIQAGTKTQTRRVVKPQPKNPVGPNFDGLWSDTKDPVTRYFASPYGKLGERLWVRETAIFQLCDKKKEKVLHYRADGHEALDSQVWTPSIYMPRWACRLTLEVTGVRVERLQSITSIDVQREGIVPSPPRHWYHASDGYAKYRNLWDKLNAKRKGGIYAWDKDPFVWVISFKKL